MADVEARILKRIERRLGVADIADLLAERLPATDLQSLLLAVTRRCAAQIQPAELLQRYERDRFVRPSDHAAAAHLALEQLAQQTLPPDFEVLALSPLCARSARSRP